MKRILLASLLTTACSSSSVEPPLVKSDLARNTTPNVPQADLDTLVADNTAFAVDLYQQVRGAPGNLFMSPHSVSTALAMTYAGATGATASQMATALRFTLPPDRLHAALNALDLELATRAELAEGQTIPFRLQTANSIWGQQDWSFQAPFLDTLAVNYGAGLHVQDFETDPEGARETINSWVEDKTNDRIQDLLPEGSIDTLTRLVLTNAIYFSAAWAEPFDAADTADRPFHVAGTPVAVPTLHQIAEMDYGAGDGWRAVQIPYDGHQLAMVVIVPDDLAAFEAGLTASGLEAVVAALSYHQVTLSLPKWRFEAPLGLKDALQQLGMSDAFSELADFSPIDGTRALLIKDVLHKGFVSVDERGTEAAAATAVIAGTTSVPPQATLAVDRPFLFMIRDLPTGATLFVGRVVDPR